MKHLLQTEIDQFVSINKSQNALEWQDHINECDYCSKRIEETLSFNLNLAKFIKVDTSPKQEEFIKKIIADDKEVYIAYPILPTLHIPNKSFTVHLAESAPPVHNVSSKYQYLGSLITKYQDILVRVVKDNNNRNTYLFLISDDQQKYKNKIVTISNTSKKYHSDSTGKVNLGKIDLPDIENLTVTITSQ